ncbi:MAG TPA: DUF2059 domain-containing protein [Xanthobacteraceae bacterium]|nr:DUF2059 domain-containing protein [Xanthobacteraceae bacterium]
MRAAMIAVLIAFGLLAPSGARAQTQPPAENVAAAREVIEIIRPADQFRAIAPSIFENFRKAVQGDAEVEKQYDAMIPLFNKFVETRLNELVEKITLIYARNFTVDDLHALAAFYHSPPGQTFIDKQAVIAQQSLAVGQEFAQALVQEVQQEMNKK